MSLTRPGIHTYILSEKSIIGYMIAGSSSLGVHMEVYLTREHKMDGGCMTTKSSWLSWHVDALEIVDAENENFAYVVNFLGGREDPVDMSFISLEPRNELTRRLA